MNLLRCPSQSEVCVIWTFLLLSTLTLVSSHSSGAPTSRCESMNPGHWVGQQTIASPYSVIIDKNVVQEGDRVPITLSATSPDQPGFKGFIVMVKKPGHDSDSYGSFDLSSSDLSKSQPLKCFEKEASAMTHKDNVEKSSVRLLWIAPALARDQAQDDFEVK
jgi:hypothetical protein